VDVSTTLQNLAKILRRRNNLPDAEVAYREAVRLTRKLFGDNFYSYSPNLALAEVLREEGKLPEAEESYRKLVTTATNLFGQQSEELCGALMRLGYTLHGQHKLAEAEVRMGEALAMRRRILKSDDPLLAGTLCDLGGVFAEDRKLTDAESAFREAVTIRRKSQANDERPFTDALQRLAQVRRDQKVFPEARSLAEEALAACDRHPDWPMQERDRAVRVLAAVLVEAGDAVQLEALRLKEAEKRLARLRSNAEAGDPESLNSLAWMLATCPESGFRDGKSAVGYAELAVTQNTRTNSAYLATLAAAYAETGEFVKAACVEKEAMALLRTEGQKRDHASRLKLYESNTPYREEL
jgi:tetratricopeptide (TPR) repeat protein